MFHDVSVVMQAWTATAYASLPHSATVYNSTLGVLGPKSPLRSLDKLHWSLASGLALVSAALGWYIVNNQHMQKQVTNSSTELSRLLLKVSVATFCLAFMWDGSGLGLFHCLVGVCNCMGECCVV